MTLITLVTLAQSEVAHFGLAFGVGLLAYWLTWIISSAGWVMVHRGTRAVMSSVVVRGTALTGLLLGLVLGLLSHLWLDGFSIWLVTPLSKSLEIIR